MPINEQDRKSNDELLNDKLIDADVPGFEVTFDPSEAEKLGIFIEGALSEDDAKDSVHHIGSINNGK